jgi:hypothetical protein
MKFKKFLQEENLNEKVSKKECTEALKNKNILVGAEFEMIIPDMIGGSNKDLEGQYEEALKDYNQYFDDIKEYESEREEYEENTELLRIRSNDLERLKDDLTEFYEKESDIKEWKDINHWLKNYKMLNNDDTIYGKLTKEDLYDYDILEDVYDTIESVIGSLDSDISYREDEGIYEEIEQPYILSYNYRDYIQYMKDLYNEYGMGEDVEAELKAGRAYYMYGENDPPEPPNPEYFDNETPDFESSLNLEDAPFDDYEVGSYGDVYQDKNSTTWAIEDDESLGSNGVEIKSPPMPLPDFVKIMDEMFDWMDDNDYETNSKTGFHIHMSMKNPSKDFDVIKLILFTDEGYIFDKFSDRLNSSYVKSVKDKLKSNGTLDKSDRKKIFDEKKILTTLVAGEHFDAINVRNVKDNHVEFRYMGSNYSDHYKDVISVLCVYAHNMALAADPDYKRKEYILKLQRIFNKIELYTVKQKLFTLNNLIEYSKEEPKIMYDFAFDNLMKALNKLKKQYEKQIKSLSMYKLSKKDQRLLMNNTKLSNSIEAEWQRDKVKACKLEGVPLSLVKKLTI